MSDKKYYWAGKGSSFSQGKNKPMIGLGEEMPKLDQVQEKLFLENGWISTEKTLSARQLSELDQLKEEVKTLRAEKSGGGKSLQSDLDRIAELEAQLESLTAPPEPEKAGPGRPKKGE